MNLEQLRALLKEKLGALKTLREKAYSKDSSEDDQSAFEAAIDELEALEKKIKSAERAEEMEARLSVRADKTVDAPTPGIGHNNPPAEAKTVKPEEALSLTAAAIVRAKGLGENPFKVLEAEGYGRFAAELAGANKSVNTLVSAEGGILVPTAQVGSIVPLLREQSTFLAAGPTRVQFTNGQYTVARGLSGSTAGYIGEGALKPVSSPTFDAINMAAKKLAGVVPLTMEAQRWTIANIEEYVRADLRAAMALTMDLNAWLGTGAGASPTGIFNKAGIQTYTPTFAAATTPTLAELDAMAAGMILKLITANIYANGRWRWVMSYRTAMKLQDMRVGASADGDAAFPSMQGVGSGNTLSWKGFPVVVTSQLPTNGGATTDETTIALVDFSHVLFGEEMGITMKMSDQATLDVDGAGTLVHLWQQNMFAIMAESMHDFGLRFVNAVVKATIRF